MSDMFIDRTVRDIQMLYHRSIVKFPGGIPFEYNGKKIKPMTPALGAESAGMKQTDFSKRVDPNQQERPFLESWVRNLHGGMSKASLDALEHSLGRVAFEVPEIETCADAVNLAAVRLGKEAGDVFGEVANATSKDSEGGVLLSKAERLAIASELRDVIAGACAMLALVEREE